MQSSILTIAIMLLFAGTAKSQEYSTLQRTPEQEAAKQLEMLQRVLPSLTDEQRETIYEINLRYAEERKLHPGRAEAIDRMQRKDNEYRSVLTPSQYDYLLYKCTEQRNALPRVDTVPTSRLLLQ